MCLKTSLNKMGRGSASLKKMHAKYNTELYNIGARAGARARARARAGTRARAGARTSKCLWSTLINSCFNPFFDTTPG